MKARQTEEEANIKMLAEAEVASAEATAAYESSMDEGPNFAEFMSKNEVRWKSILKALGIRFVMTPELPIPNIR